MVGATACMVGRPIVYGLGAMGERGADAAIRILRDEVDTTLALLGVGSLTDLTRSSLLDTREGHVTPNAVLSRPALAAPALVARGL